MTEREKLRLAQEQSQSQWKKETEAKAKADKDQKSAQAAARLDQVISSSSVKKAVDTKSAQVASRLDTGTYAVNTGTQKRLVEQEKNRKSTEAIERLNQPATAKTRGTGFHSGGGFGSQQSIRRPLGSTILDAANYGAGQFVVPVATAIDVGANMIVDPLMDVIGFVRQKNPENTLLGKGLTGITDATADFLDWTKRETLGSQARAYADAGDSKAGRTLVDLGAGVVSALPNAALAMMSGGASVGGQLAVQPVGISGTVANAASKMLKNPLAKVSFVRNFGSGFEEAKASGASDTEALMSAGLSGMMNAMVEASGGIEALPGKAGAGFRAWAGSALQEGLEEPVQGVISNAVSKGVYDHARPFASLTDENAVLNPYRAGREFAMGTAVGAIVGGGEMLGNTVAGKISLTDLPKIKMRDFTNRNSPVFLNLAYSDVETQTAIMQQTHQDMVESGSVVQIPDDTLSRVEQYYPDLRTMKKKDRTPILKQKMSELKTELRMFLDGLKDTKYEFEVNGYILDARLYDTGVREVMEKVTQDKAAMLHHSDKIFQNARYLYSTPDYDGDENVYRWNYFYSPVQIGDETVGVRVAVRDMVKTNESQIYNWGIKQDATLGGGGGVKNASHTDASSVASENSISGFLPTVNGVNLANQHAWQMPVWPVGNLVIPMQTQAEILRQMEAVRAQHQKELEEAELERAFLRGFNLEE